MLFLALLISEKLIQFARIYVAGAEIALGLGQAERTLLLLDELKPLASETPWTLQLRGEALFQLQKPQLAQNAWERSLALRPTPDVHQRLALYFENLGESEQATWHRAKAHHLMGLKHYLTNHVDPAHQEFQTAVDLDPSLALSWYYLGETHRLKGEASLAQSAYEKCLELNEHYQRARISLERLEEGTGASTENAKE